MGNCPRCQRPLPDRQAGPGRPKTYCSASCQRASAFEITRVNRQISDLEETLSKVRAGLVTAWLCDIPLIEAELALQRERLHVLLEPVDTEG